ncbi:MAG: DUF2807 domain-containing protein [Flavobacteriaceae bacterium]|nr:DUF2807 domain-containing protein [Bacteroidia bacterium]NNL15053.1 DUF2807 domain-containing protein [Flavobacteriaceae bacterium]
MKNLNSKLLLIFALAISSTLFSQNWWSNKSIKGNGNVTEITRSTSDYDAIRCAGFMDFELVKGKEGNITIEGESNLLDYIITEIEYNALVVKVKKGVNLKTSWKKGIKVTIPFEDIEKVSLAGSGDLWNKDRIEANKLKVNLSGSGDIVLKLKTGSLVSSVTGSGDITISGETGDLETKVTGSGDFHGFDLNSDNTEAYVTGSGDIRVVSNKVLKARVTGSGDIEFKGNPDLEDTKVIGSGSISK